MQYLDKAALSRHSQEFCWVLDSNSCYTSQSFRRLKHTFAAKLLKHQDLLTLYGILYYTYDSQSNYETSHDSFGLALPCSSECSKLLLQVVVSHD